MTVHLNETFEGTGYVFPWSDGEFLGGASILDEDADVADVGSPPSWLDQCLKSQLVAPDTQAYVRHNFGSDLAVTYTRIELIVAVGALATNTAVSLASAIDTSAPATIWDLQLFRDASDDLYIRYIVYHDGSPNATLFAAETGKRYRPEFLWNDTANTYAIRMDGSVLASGALTGAAASWGFGLFALGLNGANGQGSTVYYDNIQVRDDAYPGPASFARAYSAGLDWKERFEADGGTDRVWSLGTTVTSGNSLDPDKATADVTGAPADWGTRCLEVVVGAAPADDAANYHEGLATPLARAYHRVDVIVGSEGLADGESNTFIITMGVWPSPITQNIRAWINQTSGQLGVVAKVGPDATGLSLPQLGTITLDTRHIFECEWDATAGYWAMWWDGTLVASGHIRGVWAQETAHLFVGASGSGTGRSLTYYVDNYLMSQYGYPIVTSALELGSKNGAERFDGQIRLIHSFQYVPTDAEAKRMPPK